jgi:hypothetical protein
MRVRAMDGTELGKAIMSKLLSEESGNKVLEGVTWRF